MQQTWVQSLGGEDPLEVEVATHFSILAWKIPWTEEPSELLSIGSQRVGHHLVTKKQQTTIMICIEVLNTHSAKQNNL